MFCPNHAKGQGRFIRLHLKNETYLKGKLATAEADYYFDSEKGILVMNSTSPEDHIKISNRLGEVKIYYPGENEVSLQQGEYFSSENELIYYFLTNNYFDLGLAKEGYTLSETRMDGSYQVTSWAAPGGHPVVPKVELVFENNQPVYAAYFNAESEIIRKVYYYDYTIFGSFMMPLKVTQITYTAAGDSVIQRNTYSGVKVSSIADSQFYNFEIPEDAKVIR